MKDMLASLPQYQEQREAVCFLPSFFSFSFLCSFAVQFSLHTTMAQDCMTIFERASLPLIGNVEQVGGILKFASAFSQCHPSVVQLA